MLEELQRLASGAAGARETTAVAAVRAAPAAAEPVVNAETLAHLEELGASLAFVERLIRVFLADSATLLERIEKALAGRDYHEFRSLVHAMKGSSASIGTDRLTRTCTSLGALSDAELGCRRRACCARSPASSPRRAPSSRATFRAAQVGRPGALPRTV